MAPRIPAALLALAAAAAAVAMPRDADAKVFLGNEAALTAGAVGAVARGADGIWYNPAGLGGTIRNKLDLSASVFVYRVRRVPGLIEVQLSSGSYPQTGSANELVAIPSALVFTRSFTKRLCVGLGVFVPSVSDTLFKSELHSSGERVPELPYTIDGSYGLEIQQQSRLYFLGPSIGYQILPNLRVGASLFAVYSNERTNSQLFAEGHTTDAPIAQSIFYSASSFFRQGLVGLQMVVGAQWQVSRHIHLGMVVRSPALVIYRFGEISNVTTSAGFSGDPPKADPAAHDVSATMRSFSEAAFHRLIPLTVEPSIGYRTDRFWVGLTADFRAAQEETTLRVDRRVRWNVRLGGKIAVTEHTKLGAGLYTDNSDTRTVNDLGVSKVNFYGLTFGLQTRNIFNIARRLERYHLQLSTTVAVGYAIGVGQVGGWLYDPVNNPAAGQLVLRDAVYHDITLHIGSSLRF